MCGKCDSFGFLSCSSFGVWFYVILAGLILVVAGIVMLIVLKIRKNRKEPDIGLSEPLTGDSKSRDAS
jgi:hypothetical protein